MENEWGMGRLSAFTSWETSQCTKIKLLGCRVGKKKPCRERLLKNAARGNATPSFQLATARARVIYQKAKASLFHPHAKRSQPIKSALLVSSLSLHRQTKLSPRGLHSKPGTRCCLRRHASFHRANFCLLADNCRTGGRTPPTHNEEKFVCIGNV